jgi:hypothetical protein
VVTDCTRTDLSQGHGLLERERHGGGARGRQHGADLCLVHGRASVVVEVGSAAVGEAVAVEQALADLAGG